MQATLIIFAKPPAMGIAKTRLAKDIGPTHAQRVNRYCHTQTIRAASQGPWSTVLRITPDTKLQSHLGGLWPSQLDRKPQGSGDLGQRLSKAFAEAPPGPVIVVGTDAPQINTADIQNAFSALKGHDVVIGPAHDGGFWLFGASHTLRRRRLKFNPIRWSSEHTLSDLQKTLPVNTKTKLIHHLIDIDDEQALKEWKNSKKTKTS